MRSQKTTPRTVFSQLPIVDITSLFSDKLEDRLRVISNLDRATRDTGFFTLKATGINSDLIEPLKRETKRFFAQDTQTKMKDRIGESKIS